MKPKTVLNKYNKTSIFMQCTTPSYHSTPRLIKFIKASRAIREALLFLFAKRAQAILETSQTGVCGQCTPLPYTSGVLEAKAFTNLVNA